MNRLLRYSFLLLMTVVGSNYSWADDVTDKLDNSFTGVTGTTYTAFSGKSDQSDAVYAGNVAGGYSSIQMRSNNNNSGIVTTSSGGTVKSVTITWNSNTNDARELEVYGKSSAYSAASDLYGNNKGTLITSFKKSDGDKSVTIDDSYAYIGFRSKSGALYVDKIEIVWTTSGGSSKTSTTITLGDHDTACTTETTTLPLPTATVKAGDNEVSGATVTWSSSNENVATISGDDIVISGVGTTTITATYAGDDSYQGSTASYQLTVSKGYSSISEMLTDVTSTKTNITFSFTDLLVTYVNGSYVYVSDGTDGFLIYGSNLGLTAGSTYSGTISGQLYTYNDLPELSAEADGVNVTETSQDNEVTPTTVSVAQLGSNVNRYICIENAEYVSADGKKLTFAVDGTELSVYNQWNISITDLQAGEKYTLYGYGSINKGNLQLNITSFEALPYVFVGDGTKSNPYSIADVKHLDKDNLPEEKQWVLGYIVGVYSNNKILDSGNSNIAIADASDETVVGKTVPVELKSKSEAREALNIDDHPENIGKEVMVYGLITTYFGVNGLKSVTKWVLDGVPSSLDDVDYLSTLDFSLLKEDEYAAIPDAEKTAISDLTITDMLTLTSVTVSESGVDEGNKFVQVKDTTHLELNGGTLIFTAREGRTLKKISFFFKEWGEGNVATTDVAEAASRRAEGDEETGEDEVEPTATNMVIDSLANAAIWEGSADKVVLTIAGKTVLKKIVIEVGEKQGEKVTYGLASGKDIAEEVMNIYA